jgi:hypothetical protein
MEVVVHVKFMVPSTFIAQATHLYDEEYLWERRDELTGMEEDMFLDHYHQTMEKARQKA